MRCRWLLRTRIFKICFCVKNSCNMIECAACVTPSINTHTGIANNLLCCWYALTVVRSRLHHRQRAHAAVAMDISGDANAANIESFDRRACVTLWSFVAHIFVFPSQHYNHRNMRVSLCGAYCTFQVAKHRAACNWIRATCHPTGTIALLNENEIFLYFATVLCLQTYPLGISFWKPLENRRETKKKVRPYVQREAPC